MILTVIGKKQIKSFSLPQKVKGQYWLYEELDGNAERLVSVEGVNGEWVIKSNHSVKLLDSQNTDIKNTVVYPFGFYALKKKNDEKVFVFAEPISADRQVFTKYLIKGDVDLSIGRSEQNDICFANKGISHQHAVLSFKNGRWSVTDIDSTNGTFVNGMRVQKEILNIGDVIFIMGLKIIVGKQFIALNSPDGNVSVSGKLIRFVKQKEVPQDEKDDYNAPEMERFYRSPRFKREVETAVFKIDSPPTSPVAEEMPWMLVMGSSMTMGMMSLVTLGSAIASSNMTSMFTGGAMLLGTLLLPIITRTYERRRKHKKEEQRQIKYREYLNKVSAEINEACQQQEEILNENSATVQECEQRILEGQRNLWEREAGQNDFLVVRVGSGDGALNAEFQCAERKFTIDEDNLEEELFTLCERDKSLHNVPVTYSLKDNRVSGVIGQRKYVVEFAKGLIIQLAALHSYDEVKMVFIYDKKECDLDFVKWLPHVWSEDGAFRFIATDSDEVKELSAYFEKIVDDREQMNKSDLEEVSPYYVIFSMSKALSSRSEVLKKVLASKDDLHISIITLYDELSSLPKECSMIVELGKNGGRLYDKDALIAKNADFKIDIYPSVEPRELSVALANITLDTGTSSLKMPDMITFMELFGVGKVEHLNVLTRWKENDPTKSLKTAVGVGTDGHVFMLDLHEKFQGPHGLIAGMTGSGKSEFIITYILSLAVNYHPDEVAFILIDYKGGGMAKSFENLPHTAGIITNLDGAAIKRSLISIESELKRRQAIFAEASKKIGVSNIDIYKYQKLYRERTVDEPLPHLFIIADEFAELKTQQPEFMTQLISAARIGRSLGIHLILATQKPSGVVDDQIWSNSRFRVCLKVQERADSMDMLKRPDAAELTETGRFYLQVGYNEQFELGQSAWSGASYYPSEHVIKEIDNGIEVIDTNGHVIKRLSPDKKNFVIARPKKQLDAITEYLKDIADEEGIKTRPLWLEPIPSVIFLSQIVSKYSVKAQRFELNPTIGEYDDPVHQQQCVLRLPISSEGNVIVYGVAGSGKTSFVNAMIYSLIHEHTPDEVNLYILDFASETLRAFSRAPHVGDVVLSYESEKISNLFKMLQSEVEKRKKLFVDYGGDYASYVKLSRQAMASIVVVIANFSAFTETYPEKEEAVSYLSREGTKYGVYFVLTALGAGSVRFRLLQNFKQQLVLQLNDDSDYSTIVGKTNGLFPSKYKGRGLVKLDSIYEFQVAYLTGDEVPITFIQESCKELSNTWHGRRAERIPVLPDRVDNEFIAEYLDSSNVMRIPVGVEKNSLAVHYYPFDNSYITMVMSSGDECYSFANDIVSLMGGHTDVSGVVFSRIALAVSSTGNMSVCSSVKDCESRIDELFETVKYRNNSYKEALENGEKPEQFDGIFVVINSLEKLNGSLSDLGKEKLLLILEKGSAAYGINIMIVETVKNVSSFSYEKWYKSNVSQSDGIWIGRGIADQYQMKPNKTTAEMREEITPEFGYSLINGKCVRIKLLNNKPEENGYEQ